jgi:hypothetical protein
MSTQNTLGGVPAAEKVCCSCGVSVVRRLRTKDELGNYYCAICYCGQQETLQDQLAAQMPKPDLWHQVPVEAYALN